jgi:hypothetical protein
VGILQAIRKEVHGAVVRAYMAADDHESEGVGVAPEPGIDQEEDDCGFLVSDGGVKAYQREHGAR